MRSLLGRFGLGGILGLGALDSAPAVLSAMLNFPPIIPLRGPATTKRGKHKPRRHGQKLKSCRAKIGRRVRRKHRRAA